VYIYANNLLVHENKDISKENRSRERFRMNGADVLSDAELLA